MPFPPQGVGPQWLLYNLAGLYWRVHGNLYNGIECLRRAVATAPEEWRDVPLVNLAALLYTAGHIDDALTLTLQAMSVADHEVCGDLTGPSLCFMALLLQWKT